jgi:hypothetical protein
MTARKRSFKVATCVEGKQFRMVLGYWPLMSVDEARALAADVLRECRAGRTPSRVKVVPVVLPTLSLALMDYRLAIRLGAPRFMLHDLRKLVATVSEKLGLGDDVLRRILNHTAPKSNVLHRHCGGLKEADVAGAMVCIQEASVGLMGIARLLYPSQR